VPGSRTQAGESRDTTGGWVTRRDGVGCGERGQDRGVSVESPASCAGPRTLECRLLLPAYADLRVADPSADGRLAASLAEHGQKSPVLVVGRGAGWVLIDGYRRVRLLTKLGHDTVECLELALEPKVASSTPVP